VSDTPALPDSPAPSPAVGRVFVSYASQDGQVATHLCELLEAASIACWIAPRDVHPGQPYAAAIVHALNDCRALVLLVSQHSVASPHVHREVERASSKGRTVYSVRLDNAELPAELEYFLSANQWLDAAGKPVDTIVPALVQTLRHPGAAHLPHAATGQAPTHTTPPQGTAAPLKKLGMVIAAIAVVGSVVERVMHKPAEAPAAPAAPIALTEPAAAAPPAHSVAVLPFENLSGAKDQEYFSDGLSEELLNSLSAIRELQVAARTSSFSFKGSKASTRDIAQQLNVATLLEGSVRRDRHHVRISAQLVNAATGFQMWSSSYDREIKDVLSLQTEIATAVTKALQVTLMADASTAIELGGTQDAAALDAYLRGRSLERQTFDEANTMGQYKAYSEAIALDPAYAKAYAGAASSSVSFSNNFASEGELDIWKARARQLAEKAVTLAPKLGAAHGALALVWERIYLDFSRARAEYDQALALTPNDVEALLRSGWFMVNLGFEQEGMARIRRAQEIDQLNPRVYARAAYALFSLHRYAESIATARRYLQMTPGDVSATDMIGMNELGLGNAGQALATCSDPKRSWLGKLCRTLALDQLHRTAEADVEYKEMRDQLGKGASYQYAEIEAGRGHVAQALDQLEEAYKVKDPGIVNMRHDAYLDSLRKEPRFQAVYQALNFPK
jgi:serine/threonine-protein kinase